MTKKKTISIRIDSEIWKKAKICAAQEDAKIGEFVEKALKQSINKNK